MLADSAKVVEQNADGSASRDKTYFAVESQDRQFQPGDEALVLLPSYTSKLLIAWRVPFKVLEKKSKVYYLMLYHANLNDTFVVPRSISYTPLQAKTVMRTRKE